MFLMCSSNQKSVVFVMNFIDGLFLPLMAQQAKIPIPVIRRVLLFLLGSYLLFASQIVQSESVTKTINMGDTIAVSVYNEPDLNIKSLVDSSGVVQFPLIGTINVLGLTPSALATEISQRYNDGYLVDPVVHVSIEKYKPFYIHGEVKSPGVYDFAQALSVEQAIAIAGGLTERASSSAWFIARGGENEPIEVQKDTAVVPGDIITIKSSFF